MTKNKCGKCGKDPAAGYAKINSIRYCHDGPSPTCYERVWYEDFGFGTAEELARLTGVSSESVEGDGQ